jgi:protein NUD1
MMRWVRDTQEATRLPETVAERDPSGESEDPFRDIESLREEEEASRRRSTITELHATGHDPIPEDREREDPEERELHSFSFDDRSLAVVPVMTGIEGEDPSSALNGTMTTDTDSEGDGAGKNGDFLEMSEVSDSVMTEDVSEGADGIASTAEIDPAYLAAAGPSPSAEPDHQNVIGTWSSSTWPRRFRATVTPSPRPALRTATGTPSSVLKDPTRSRYQTPDSRFAHQRSVSFSDGKRDGPIINAQEIDASTELMSEGQSNLTDASKNEDVFVPSARSKRIADMMQHLEEEEESSECLH